MKLIEIKDLSHEFARYDENGDKCGFTSAISSVSLEISEGSFVAVLGRNGSGKSTLSKHLNALLLPTEGTVLIRGMDTKQSDKLLKIRQEMGMVFQNPDNQIVTSIIEEDVAFGPENLGVPGVELAKRVTDCLNKVGMTAYRFHSPNRLSGGQKQRIAIASVLAMKPKCIIMDEATAMLDPDGRKEVLETVKKLNREEGITVIFITHYMEETVDADRIIVMDEGKIVMDGTPTAVFSTLDKIRDCGLTLPDITSLGKKLRENGLPVSFPVLHKEELVKELAACKKTFSYEYCDKSEDKKPGVPEPIIQLDNIGYIYSPCTPMAVEALKGVSFSIERGSFIGIAGHTGSGKSTLLQLLNGLIEPTSGKVLISGEDIWEQDEEDTKKGIFRKKKKRHPRRELTGKVGLVFQYPEYQLFEETVLKDVAFGPKNMGLSQKEAEERAKEALHIVGIKDEYLTQSPFVLSGGQKRRVAIAGILAMDPEILVLDEPTAGLDPAGRFEILELVKGLNKEKNITILLVSHSMEDIAEYADRMIVMNDGRLIFDDIPGNVFQNRKELLDMGLGVPAVCEVIDELNKEGMRCRPAYTVEDAVLSITTAFTAKEEGEEA